MKPKRKPTLRQKKALANIVANRGSEAQALRDAGYSEQTARNPKQILESPTFRDLAKEFMPDDLLIRTHLEGLGATKQISAVIVGKNADERTHDFVEVPDYAARHNYLKTAYQVRGLLDSDGAVRTLNLVIKDANGIIAGIAAGIRSAGEQAKP